MLFQIIIKILFRKDVEEMAVVYATLIIKGKRTLQMFRQGLKSR